MKISKILKKLYIAEDDFFNIQGNNDFSKYKDKKGVLERGKWPYYQPTVGKRMGVNVSIYGEDESWLHPGENQWAVGFYGIRSPD